MLRIAIDMMGADHGPLPLIQGTLEALKQHRFEAFLIGCEETIKKVLEEESIDLPNSCKILHMSDHVSMGENATDALKNKNTSLYKAIDMHRNSEVDAVVSAGHSGAVMSLATLRIGRIRGVLRPVLGVLMPTIKRQPTLLLDVGANVDCKPSHLAQFFLMGRCYAKKVMSVDAPRIGLLANGEESSKGNELTKETYALLKHEDNFMGNVEGNNILDGSVDVVVCDGFVGNLVLKSCEGVASAIKTLVKDQFQLSSIFTKIAGLFLKGIAKDIANTIDYAEHGGAPLIGLKGCVIVAHGKSNAKAIKNAIFQAIRYQSSHINEDLERDIAQFKTPV